MIHTKHWTTLALAAAGILALGLGDLALAKQGRGRGRGRGGDAKAERVKEKIGLSIVDTVDVAPRKARLRIRRKKASRNELRIQLGDAVPGFDLDVWFADAAGAMTRIAGMRESNDDVGDYDWRVRTKKGQALPFGVSDVADLAGRSIEVRNGAVVVVRGAMPDIAPAAPAAGKRANVRSPLSSSADDAGTDDSPDDSLDDSPGDGVQAEIRLRRKADREELKVEVEHAVSGLSLALWIADDASVLTEIGVLLEEQGEDGTEYELKLRTDRDVLPFGLTSVAGLSERAVEIRNGAGAVVAAGFVPRLGERAADDDDDSGDDDSGDDDSGDDDSGDDDSDDDDSDDDDADDDADDDDAAV